jgi:hypothetical protein
MAGEEGEVRRLAREDILRLPELKIAAWKEVIGEYIGSATSKNEFHMAVDVGGKQYRITVPKGSKHRETLDAVEMLDDLSLTGGKKKRIRLGILFTDDAEQPVRLKRIV